MSFINSKYIEPEYEKNVKAYKYKGEDRSIAVKYILKPLSRFIISYTPEWIAPNVITASGWFLNLFYCSLSIIVAGWGTKQDIPPWLCYVIGSAYLTYIVLDYCDGTQARKLGASSPLGLLVDHGTDACTTFFITIGLHTILRLNDIYQSLGIYLGIAGAFFFSTWEEYYLGVLDLPMIHGVAEGAFMIFFACILSGFYGYSFESYHLFYLFGKYDIKVNIFEVGIVFFGGLFYLFTSFFKVVFKLDKEKRKDAIKTAFMFVLFYGNIVCLRAFHNSVIVKQYPKFVFLAFGFEFAKLMSELQLSHVKLSPYPCYKLVYVLPLFISIGHTFIYHFTGKQFLISIDYILVGIFVWNLLSWIHFVYFASEEVCEIYNIHRFVLGKRRPEIIEGDKDKNKKSQ